jgi:hypothetical protein
MKRTVENGKQIGFIRQGCKILKVSIDTAGNPTTLHEDSYDDESECKYQYDEIQLPESADPIPPLGPWPVQARGDASQLNQSKYYTGRTCKYGHVSQRYVSSGLCIACISAKSKGFKINRDAAKSGLVPLNLMVHPEDAQAVRGYAEAVAQARALS